LISSCIAVRGSAVNTFSSWSICTGVVVCDSGIVPPSGRIGALGEPGAISMKKVPSRNSLGLIFIVASVCSGRPCGSMLIVASAVVPGPRPTEMTLPTLTPAIRTGEPGWIWLAS
jgi:hypothetical protein